MRGDQVQVQSVAYVERNAAPVSRDNKGVQITLPDASVVTHWAETWAAAEDKAKAAGHRR